ncbi:MAG: 6-phosphogluconolactonase, partial [Tannerella sp.]|nr:6-phosphogluconolactonase [Tannerella sp.]
PADDKESNYGEFYRLLVATGVIPRESVFPFKYNVDEQQALKDAEALIGKIPFVDGLPRFDLIILGIGEDGHTASIFPGNLQSFESRRIVEIAVHPQTKQHRLTLTGSVINNAEDIIFLCTGASKKPVIDEIVNRKNRSLPASRVSASGSLFFYVDEAVVSR